ncbi:MAG TPA: lamin tail domain-containing protein [Pyrinomonadaceae bacterium]|nr:lamin tail domain-containing protein [Pyrinomonadaceae bacterium]
MNSSSYLSLRLLVALVVLTVSFSAHAQTEPSADIVVSTSGDETVALGGQITYNLIVYNGGPDDAVNIVLTDAIPAHTSFVSASTNTGSVSFDGTTLTVNVGTLAFDSTAVATLVVQVDQNTSRGTIINNTVTGTSDTSDPDPSNNSAEAMTAVTGPFAGDLLISEFRLRGPAGDDDEFIELYNNTDAPIAVATTDGSSGWALAASDGVIRFIIPNGTIIPARGHFLGVNSNAYSLSDYPAGINDGETATATGDATYETGIPDNAGIALFRTSETANFSTATRLDAVGSTAEANTLYKDGTGYPVLVSFDAEYAWVRDTCGKGGSITTFGPCPTAGLPRNTNNNAADFYAINPNGTDVGAGQRLGAPGPENLSSPIQRNADVLVLNLDGTVSSTSLPNRVRDFTSDPVNSSTFGTLDIRRRVVNATGFPVTRLRFRIVDISTFAAPAGIADLRARTSTDLTVSGINDEGTCLGVAPCDVTVLGTTLEQPPNQSNGGGFNSSLSSDSVTLATPLAPGDSINVHFLLGVQQTGSFKFYVNIELLTDESGGELLRAASTPGLRKSTRGTMVKTGTASSTPALPKLTIQSSRASKVMKVSLGPIEGEGPTGKLGSLGRTVAGKVAKRVAKQAVTAPAKS